MFVKPGSVAPRRCQLDQLSEVENKLVEAMAHVETLGASVDLTTMSVVLEDARANVARIIDARLQLELNRLGEEAFLERYDTLDTPAMVRLMSDIY